MKTQEQGHKCRPYEYDNYNEQKKQNEIMIGKRDKNCDNTVIYIRIQPAYTHIHIFISLWYISIWDASLDEQAEKT